MFFVLFFEAPSIFFNLSSIKVNGITSKSYRSKQKPAEFSDVFRLLGVKVEIHISIITQDLVLLEYFSTVILLC